MILERLKEYIDYKRISIAAFEKSVGMSNASFGKSLKNGGAIGTDKLENILITYSDINPIWLLTGEGSMLKEEQIQEKVVVNTDSNTLLYNIYSDLQKKDLKIDSLNIEIKELQAENKVLNKELTELKLINQKQEAYIKRLEKALEYYENIGTIQNFSMEQEHRVGDVPFVESLSPTPPPSARVNVRIEKGKSNK